MKIQPFLYITFIGVFALLNLRYRVDAAVKDGMQPTWTVKIYPKIGFKVLLPSWTNDVTDTATDWSLLALPLVENPAADVQYRVRLDVLKMSSNKFARLYRANDTDDWGSVEHLSLSRQTNNEWIYLRKDQVVSNGYVYSCSARIKRVLKAGGTNSETESDSDVVRQVENVISSIDVVSTNALVKVLSEYSLGTSELPSDRSRTNIFGETNLFAAMTDNELIQVKQAFTRLNSKMTVRDCLSILGIDLLRVYPASSWRIRNRQFLSLMLSNERVLLLVVDMDLKPALVIGAQLDNVEWGERPGM